MSANVKNVLKDTWGFKLQYPSKNMSKVEKIEYINDQITRLEDQLTYEDNPSMTAEFNANCKKILVDTIRRRQKTLKDLMK